MHVVVDTIPVAKYFLCGPDKVEREVSREEFIQAERAEGFYPIEGDGVATTGFDAGVNGVSGTIRYE